MSRVPLHPTRDQIELSKLLDCLSDPIRLAIVCSLARHDPGAAELRCGDFNAFGGKSNLAYHFARLREAGLVRTRIAGTTRHLKLRREDLEARFPGLLDSILAAAARDAGPLPLPEREIAAAD